MSDETTQVTPKGNVIPVPERTDVLAALRKVATAPARDDEREDEAAAK